MSQPRILIAGGGKNLGGLVARWWVQEMGGAERTRRVVTLATPHAGTRSARVAPGPLRAALMPQGAIVRRLAAGRHRATAVSHTALVAAADLMVTPPSSAAALEDADVEWFDGLGHNAMLFDPRVHARVGRRAVVAAEGHHRRREQQHPSHLSTHPKSSRGAPTPRKATRD